MLSDTLFDPGPAKETEAPLSAAQRRTARQRNALARGRHPVTGLELTGNGHTCGDCCHARLQGGTNGRYWKCGATDGRYVTRGGASDIRLKWPACRLWGTPDAA